jgi:hypothetical protein
MPQGQALLDAVGTAFARLRRRTMQAQVDPPGRDPASRSPATNGSPRRSPRVTRDPHAAAQAMHDHVMLVCDVALLREEP